VSHKTRLARLEARHGNNVVRARRVIEVIRGDVHEHVRFARAQHVDRHGSHHTVDDLGSWQRTDSESFGEFRQRVHAALRSVAGVIVVHFRPCSDGEP
jgi:hypothetical protein